MKARHLAFVALLFAGCSSEPAPIRVDTPSSPQVPSPSVVQAAVDVHQEQRWLHHPWVVQQGIMQLSQGIVDDLEAIAQVHQQLNIDRERHGMAPVAEEQDLEMIIAAVDKLHSRIEGIGCQFHPDWYRVLALPELHLPSLGYSGHIYDRHYLATTKVGFPLNLDTRVFPLVTEKPLQAQLTEIVAWHANTLDGGDEAFNISTAGPWTIMLGTGKRNANHYDPSHGFANGERTIFLASRLYEGRAIVLYLDGPEEDVEPFIEQLRAIPG